jgi:hypothetical protein
VLLVSGLACIFVLGPMGLFALVRWLRVIGFDSDSPGRNLAFAVMLLGMVGVSWLLVRCLDPFVRQRSNATGFMDWVNHGPGGQAEKVRPASDRD